MDSVAVVVTVAEAKEVVVVDVVTVAEAKEVAVMRTAQAVVVVEKVGERDPMC